MHRCKTKIFLGCALLGTAFFLLVYGSSVLNVSYDAWIFNGYVETDIIQRYAGWLAYRATDNFFPLTYSKLISYPFGDYTSLADSIPLAEIFFKLLSPILPKVFQYEGILALLNLALQGLCGGLLVSLFTDDSPTIFAGAGLLCLSPVLLERIFRHTSLSFHWMLLLAIWLYFRALRSGQLRWVIWQGFLALFSVGLHLYFTPMLLGFLAAAALDLRHGRQKVCAVGIFAGSAGGCLLFAKALGLLEIGLSNTSGYGTMGMNLNALFNPVSLDADWWVPGKGRMDWSLFLPPRALAENNLESFNYLGIGVLIGLCAAGLLLLFRLWGNSTSRHVLLFSALSFIKRHLFLLLFALCSTIFAVSNVICAFSHVLLRVPLPQLLLSIFSAFRASGRLFWGVYYLLFLSCIVLWIRLPAKRRGARLALIFLCLLQLVDLSPTLLQKHNQLNQPLTTSIQEKGDALLAALDGRHTLYFLEPNDDRALCGWLLRAGVSNNLPLISREGYGVAALEEERLRVQSVLLKGESPYPDCGYLTADPDLAAKLSADGKLVQIENVGWLLLPAEGSQTSSE